MTHTTCSTTSTVKAAYYDLHPSTHCLKPESWQTTIHTHIHTKRQFGVTNLINVAFCVSFGLREEAGVHFLNKNMQTLHRMAPRTFLLRDNCTNLRPVYTFFVMHRPPVVVVIVTARVFSFLVPVPLLGPHPSSKTAFILTALYTVVTPFASQLCKICPPTDILKTGIVLKTTPLLVITTISVSRTTTSHDDTHTQRLAG